LRAFAQVQPFLAPLRRTSVLVEQCNMKDVVIARMQHGPGSGRPVLHSCNY
jgi:hypothetical protein